MCKYPAFKGVTTISNEQINKSFKPTYMSKKIVGKYFFQMFWKDPIKSEQIRAPNDNFLYQMMIFSDWSIWYSDNFMKMPQLNRK